MRNNKIFILLPDGVGLRNFAYTNFYNLGKSLGYDLTFWNVTDFDLEKFGFNQISIKHSALHPKTDLLKKAKARIELNRSTANTKDKIYDSYRHILSYKTPKDILKSLVIKAIEYTHSFNAIRKSLQQQERKTKYYQDCYETLQREKPAFVLCTNHRTTKALAPIAAAKDLGIPTAAFIFSWDNLPKATKVIETDYYFVWSDHMKDELLYYYPYIKENQVFVTGTPQFESHYNTELLESKESFFGKHGLDIKKKYICYSGDDITTSPNDPQYLSDVADAVRELNSKGNNIGIVFRRAPVDFSTRFDDVLNRNKDLIVSIIPKWESIGEVWNTVFPTKADTALQMNTIYHTEMVINLGSSMVFDYVAHEKPCAFINYDIPDSPFSDWSVKTIYNYIHFRSMPDKKAVIWLNSPNEIAARIDAVLQGNTETVAYAHHWFQKINLHPPKDASKRIFESIGKIITDKNTSN